MNPEILKPVVQETTQRRTKGNCAPPEAASLRKECRRCIKNHQHSGKLTECLYQAVSEKMEAVKKERRRDSISGMLKLLGVSRSGYNTYIWTGNGFVYLTSIMDLFSRRIIAWTLSDSMEVTHVVDPVNKAIARRNGTVPAVVHSDRGSQYVAKEYKRATARMQRSYSKKAYPWDTACIESFHALIKREWLNRFKRLRITRMRTV